MPLSVLIHASEASPNFTTSTDKLSLYVAHTCVDEGLGLSENTIRNTKYMAPGHRSSECQLIWVTVGVDGVVGK